MAEFEEITELMEQTEGGIEEEAGDTEGLTEEESEELEEEAEETKENVSALGKVVDFVKGLEVPQVLKSFAVFVAKNAAMASVFYGVGFLLKKLMAKSSGDKEQQNQRMHEKVKAVATLISDISKILTELCNWFNDKKNVDIDVGDGIKVPLPDVFTKFLKPLENVSFFLQVE